MKKTWGMTKAKTERNYQDGLLIAVGYKTKGENSKGQDRWGSAQHTSGTSALRYSP